MKQERARAEEALHKQARRRNQTYSKYSGDGRGGSGRRPAMDIDYLEVMIGSRLQQVSCYLMVMVVCTCIYQSLDLYQVYSST